MKISGVCFVESDKKSENHPDAVGPGDVEDASGTGFQQGDESRLAVWKTVNKRTGAPMLRWVLELDDRTVEYGKRKKEQRSQSSGGQQSGQQGGGAAEAGAFF